MKRGRYLRAQGNGKKQRPWDPTRETAAKPNCVTTADAAVCGGGYTKRERGAGAERDVERDWGVMPFRSVVFAVCIINVICLFV
jgi:hypothetical protein